jgi:hypothetical protein
MAAATCQHLVDLSSASFPPPATPNACEDCLREGTRWIALRRCRECGHVGCCDSSPRRHATRHFHATGHPVTWAIAPPSAQWVRVDYTGSVETDLLDDGMGHRRTAHAEGHCATTNTIVQWPWGNTHAPITCAEINRAVEDQRDGIAIDPILEVAVA